MLKPSGKVYNVSYNFIVYLILDFYFTSTYRYWECFRDEIGKSIDMNEWRLKVNPRSIKWQKCGSLSIIGIILHLTNDLPIFFETSNLDYLRQHLALSILQDKLAI